jgi:predicted alpha/beta-fold hydrolase
MKKSFMVLSIFILLAASCTARETRQAEFQSTEPSNPSPLPAQPSQLPTSQSTATSTPRPTIDLKLVLTSIITVEYQVKYITLWTSDDVQIIAKQYGEGEPAVILAHQGTFGASQRDWDPFARMIAQRGYTAATLDFRGYGHSKGDSTARNYLIRDMRALIDYLKGEGYRRFVCIGASMGGTTCLRAAVEYDLEGIVIIGSLWSNGEPTAMYEAAQEPKQLRIFPGDVHGTLMFRQPYGQQFTAELLVFLEMLR